MANASSAVVATDAVVHTQYNNLRLDAIGPYNADRVWNDNQKATFGTGSDAFITYDGTNLVVDPKAVGSGVMSVLGSIMLEPSASLKVSSDEILSDSSGTMTLKNIDALDATTEATIESAIDTLGSLTAASSLATVGTITSGVWQGTPVASSYIGSHTHTESDISNLGTAVALVADKLSVFASTTSAELRGVISNETGTGSLVFATSPTLVTPDLGTPSALVGTNITGTAANLTAGTVTTNANLTGHVTSTGNATVLGSFTKAQLSAAVSDGTVLYSGDATSYTDADAIAAVEGEGTLVLQSGATIGGSAAATVGNKLSAFAATTSAELRGVISDETGSGALVFATSPTFVTPALGTPASGVATNLTGTASGLTAGNVTTNANLTGHVTSTGNATVLGSFTKSQLSAAVSDGTPLYSGDVGTYTAGDGLDVSGGGEFSVDLKANGGLEISSTELSVAQGISQYDVAQFGAGVADDDFLRIDGTAVEGRSASEVLSDIGAQASLTFGISNTNAVKIDAADVADDEYARFTANGLESRTAAEVAADIEGSIDAVGALDGGSITSNFGNINIGASTFDTTGAVATGALTTTGAIEQSGGAVAFNQGSGDYDFKIESDGTDNIFHVDGGVNGGKGSVTLGYSANPDANNRAFFKVYPPAITTATDKSTSWVGIQPDYAMTMAGTVPVAASLAVEEPNISGTPTLASTLYIKDAPTEGSTNAALYVESGNSHFGGIVDITDATDATDATGDTGALRTEGGASIAKKLYVGTDLDVDGTAELDNITIGGAQGSDGQVLTSTGSGVAWEDASGGSSVDSQTFTSSGTWTKPAGVTFVFVEVMGGGGGGGSGDKDSTYYSAGGGGGAGGANDYRLFLASELDATETVTIGAGGSGGASQTNNGWSGNNGSSGGSTIFKNSSVLSGTGGGGGNGGGTYEGVGGTSSPDWGHKGGSGARGDTNNGGTGGSGKFTGGGGAGGGQDADTGEHQGGNGGSAGGLAGGAGGAAGGVGGAAAGGSAGGAAGAGGAGGAAGAAGGAAAAGAAPVGAAPAGVAVGIT